MGERLFSLGPKEHVLYEVWDSGIDAKLLRDREEAGWVLVHTCETQGVAPIRDGVAISGTYLAYTFMHKEGGNRTTKCIKCGMSLSLCGLPDTDDVITALVPKGMTKLWTDPLPPYVRVTIVPRNRHNPWLE